MYCQGKFLSFVSICCHDRSGLVNDHENMLRRLSLKPPAAHVHDRALPDELSEEAFELLKLAVARPKTIFETEAASFSAGLKEKFKHFLEHEAVRQSSVWKATFGTPPPKAYSAATCSTCWGNAS